MREEGKSSVQVGAAQTNEATTSSRRHPVCSSHPRGPAAAHFTQKLS